MLGLGGMTDCPGNCVSVSIVCSLNIIPTYLQSDYLSSCSSPGHMTLHDKSHASKAINLFRKKQNIRNMDVRRSIMTKSA